MGRSGYTCVRHVFCTLNVLMWVSENPYLDSGSCLFWVGFCTFPQALCDNATTVSVLKWINQSLPLPSTSHPYNISSQRLILMLSFHLLLILPSICFQRIFPSKILCECLVSPKLLTCTALNSILDYSTGFLVMLDDLYTSRNSSSFVGRNIFPCILISDSCNVYSFLKVKHCVSDPYKKWQHFSFIFSICEGMRDDNRKIVCFSETSVSTYKATPRYSPK
jgi:hypothetical protein